jgi:hypothetical protein
MKSADPVRDFLKRRGSPGHVVREGLKGLVERWERTVDDVANGYSLGLDDYLNDMDGRQLIEEVLAVAVNHGSLLKRIMNADHRMRDLVTPSRHCLWGEHAALQHGWSPEKNWWFFSQPKTPGAELSAELGRH